jgi:hypothetical protein
MNILTLNFLHSPESLELTTVMMELQMEPVKYDIMRYTSLSNKPL